MIIDVLRRWLAAGFSWHPFRRWHYIASYPSMRASIYMCSRCIVTAQEMETEMMVMTSPSRGGRKSSSPHNSCAIAMLLNDRLLVARLRESLILLNKAAKLSYITCCVLVPVTGNV